MLHRVRAHYCGPVLEYRPCPREREPDIRNVEVRLGVQARQQPFGLAALNLRMYRRILARRCRATEHGVISSEHDDQ